MNYEEKKENRFKVLVTKEPKIFVFNCNTKKIKEGYHKMVSGVVVRFYSITYDHKETSKYINIKKIGVVPINIDVEYFESI